MKNVDPHVEALFQQSVTEMHRTVETLRRVEKAQKMREQTTKSQISGLLAKVSIVTKPAAAAALIPNLAATTSGRSTKGSASVGNSSAGGSSGDGGHHKQTIAGVKRKHDEAMAFIGPYSFSLFASRSLCLARGLELPNSFSFSLPPPLPQKPTFTALSSPRGSSPSRRRSCLAGSSPTSSRHIQQRSKRSTLPREVSGPPRLASPRLSSLIPPSISACSWTRLVDRLASSRLASQRLSLASLPSLISPSQTTCRCGIGSPINARGIGSRSKNASESRALTLNF